MILRNIDETNKNYEKDELLTNNHHEILLVTNVEPLETINITKVITSNLSTLIQEHSTNSLSHTGFDPVSGEGGFMTKEVYDVIIQECKKLIPKMNEDITKIKITNVKTEGDLLVIDFDGKTAKLAIPHRHDIKVKEFIVYRKDDLQITTSLEDGEDVLIYLSREPKSDLYRNNIYDYEYSFSDFDNNIQIFNKKYITDRYTTLYLKGNKNFVNGQTINTIESNGIDIYKCDELLSCELDSNLYMNFDLKLRNDVDLKEETVLFILKQRNEQKDFMKIILKYDTLFAKVNAFTYYLGKVNTHFNNFTIRIGNNTVETFDGNDKKSYSFKINNLFKTDCIQIDISEETNTIGRSVFVSKDSNISLNECNGVTGTILNGNVQHSKSVKSVKDGNIISIHGDNIILDNSCAIEILDLQGNQLHVKGKLDNSIKEGIIYNRIKNTSYVVDISYMVDMEEDHKMLQIVKNEDIEIDKNDLQNCEFVVTNLKCLKVVDSENKPVFDYFIVVESNNLVKLIFTNQKEIDVTISYRTNSNHTFKFKRLYNERRIIKAEDLLNKLEYSLLDNKTNESKTLDYGKILTNKDDVSLIIDTTKVLNIDKYSLAQMFNNIELHVILDEDTIINNTLYKSTDYEIKTIGVKPIVENGKVIINFKPKNKSRVFISDMSLLSYDYMIHTSDTDKISNFIMVNKDNNIIAIDGQNMLVDVELIEKSNILNRETFSFKDNKFTNNVYESLLLLDTPNIHEKYKSCVKTYTKSYIEDILHEGQTITINETETNVKSYDINLDSTVSFCDGEPNANFKDLQESYIDYDMIGINSKMNILCDNNTKLNTFRTILSVKNSFIETIMDKFYINDIKATPLQITINYNESKIANIFNRTDIIVINPGGKLSISLPHVDLNKALFTTSLLSIKDSLNNEINLNKLKDGNVILVNETDSVQTITPLDLLFYNIERGM